MGLWKPDLEGGGQRGQVQQLLPFVTALSCHGDDTETVSAADPRQSCSDRLQSIVIYYGICCVGAQSVAVLYPIHVPHHFWGWGHNPISKYLRWAWHLTSGG